MMDGKNCTGRKISLLNDSSDVATQHYLQQQQRQQKQRYQQHTIPRLTTYSRTSSNYSDDSSPSFSPQTPQLIRSSSSDSRGLASPSPLTPSSAGNFDQHAAAHLSKQHQHYFLQNPQYHHRHQKMDDPNDPNDAMYPPIPDATGAMPTAYPMPPHMMPQMTPLPPQPQMQRQSTSPSSEPSRISAVSNTSNAKVPQKKNQYPCPMAKQIGCTDFFTTSGHAARHAKKHTGKKDAYCPECNKAFTRKDNMEQHRRTHQNGRGPSRSSEDSKVKKPVKASIKKASSVKSESLSEVIAQQVEDQQAQAVQAQAQIEQQQAQQHQHQQHQQHQQQIQHPQPVLDQNIMLPPSGPYFLNGMDTGPIATMPMPVVTSAGRPPLHRSNFTNSLEYVPPPAPMTGDLDTLHYSYPSPGLSNGLNSLALAACEHRRMSEEQSQAESPTRETP